MIRTILTRTFSKKSVKDDEDEDEHIKTKEIATGTPKKHKTIKGSQKTPPKNKAGTNNVRRGSSTNGTSESVVSGAQQIKRANSGIGAERSTVPAASSLARRAVSPVSNARQTHPRRRREVSGSDESSSSDSSEDSDCDVSSSEESSSGNSYESSEDGDSDSSSEESEGSSSSEDRENRAISQQRAIRRRRRAPAVPPVRVVPPPKLILKNKLSPPPPPQPILKKKTRRLPSPPQPRPILKNKVKPSVPVAPPPPIPIRAFPGSPKKQPMRELATEPTPPLHHNNDESSTDESADTTDSEPILQPVQQKTTRTGSRKTPLKPALKSNLRRKSLGSQPAKKTVEEPPRRKSLNFTSFQRRTLVAERRPSTPEKTHRGYVEREVESERAARRRDMLASFADLQSGYEHTPRISKTADDSLLPVTSDRDRIDMGRLRALPTPMPPKTCTGFDAFGLSSNDAKLEEQSQMSQQSREEAAAAKRSFLEDIPSLIPVSGLHSYSNEVGNIQTDSVSSARENAKEKVSQSDPLSEEYGGEQHISMRRNGWESPESCEIRSGKTSDVAPKGSPGKGTTDNGTRADEPPLGKIQFVDEASETVSAVTDQAKKNVAASKRSFLESIPSIIPSSEPEALENSLDDTEDVWKDAFRLETDTGTAKAQESADTTESVARSFEAPGTKTAVASKLTGAALPESPDAEGEITAGADMNENIPEKGEHVSPGLTSAVPDTGSFGTDKSFTEVFKRATCNSAGDAIAAVKRRADIGMNDKSVSVLPVKRSNRTVESAQVGADVQVDEGEVESRLFHALEEIHALQALIIEKQRLLSDKAAEAKRLQLFKAKLKQQHNICDDREMVRTAEQDIATASKDDGTKGEDQFHSCDQSESVGKRSGATSIRTGIPCSFTEEQVLLDDRPSTVKGIRGEPQGKSCWGATGEFSGGATLGGARARDEHRDVDGEKGVGVELSVHNVVCPSGDLDPVLLVDGEGRASTPIDADSNEPGNGVDEGGGQQRAPPAPGDKTTITATIDDSDSERLSRIEAPPQPQPQPSRRRFEASAPPQPRPPPRPSREEDDFSDVDQSVTSVGDLLADFLPGEEMHVSANHSGLLLLEDKSLLCSNHSANNEMKDKPRVTASSIHSQENKNMNQFGNDRDMSVIGDVSKCDSVAEESSTNNVADNDRLAVSNNSEENSRYMGTNAKAGSQNCTDVDIVNVNAEMSDVVGEIKVNAASEGNCLQDGDCGSGYESEVEDECTDDDQFHSCDEFDTLKTAAPRPDLSEPKHSWQGDFRNQTMEVKEQSVDESGSHAVKSGSEADLHLKSNKIDYDHYPEQRERSHYLDIPVDERGMLAGHVGEIDSGSLPRVMPDREESDHGSDGDSSPQSNGCAHDAENVSQEDSGSYACLTDSSHDSGTQALAGSLHRRKVASEDAKTEASRLEEHRVLAARQRGEQMRKEYQRQKEERKIATRAKETDHRRLLADGLITEAEARRTEQIYALAATRIQAVFRGWSTYEFYMILRDSASDIQAQVRGRQTRTKLSEMRRERKDKDKSRSEQHFRCTKKSENEIPEMSSNEDEARDTEMALESAATCIQAAFRGWSTAEFFLIQRFAAIDIQAQIRGLHGRKDIQRLKQAGTTEAKAAGDAKLAEQRFDAAATRIQAMYRSRSVCEFFVLQRIAASKIQALVRWRLSRKRTVQLKEANREEEERRAAKDEAKYMAERRHQAAIRLQAAYRGWSGGACYSMKRLAICVIQAHVRGQQGRTEGERRKAANRTEYQAEARRLEEERLSVEAESDRFNECRTQAATRIQAIFRGWATAEQYFVKRFAVKFIQAHVRGYQDRKEHHRRIYARRAEFEVIRREEERAKIEVEAIQCVCAATRIQAAYRGWSEAEYYSLKRLAVCVIQAQMRGLQSRRKYGQKKDTEKVEIEAPSMRKGEERHANEAEAKRLATVRLEAATQIEASSRGWSFSTSQNTKRDAACAIQAHLRGRHARKRYKQITERKCAGGQDRARRTEEHRIAEEEETSLEKERPAADKAAVKATGARRSEEYCHTAGTEAAEVRCIEDNLTAAGKREPVQAQARPRIENIDKADNLRKSDSTATHAKGIDMNKILLKLKPKDTKQSDETRKTEDPVAANVKDCYGEATRNPSAIKIQTAYRRWAAYEFYGLQRYAAILIQAEERGRQVRCMHVEWKKTPALPVIQSASGSDQPENGADPTWQVVLSSPKGAESGSEDKDLPPIVSSKHTSHAEDSVSEVSDDVSDVEPVPEDLLRLKAESLLLAADRAVPDGDMSNATQNRFEGKKEDEAKTPDDPPASKFDWGFKIFSRSKGEIEDSKPDCKHDENTAQSPKEHDGFSSDDRSSNCVQFDTEDGKRSCDDDPDDIATQERIEDPQKASEMIETNSKPNKESEAKSPGSKSSWGFNLFASSKSGMPEDRSKLGEGDDGDAAGVNSVAVESPGSRQGNISLRRNEVSTVQLVEHPMPLGEQEPTGQRKSLKKEEKSRSAWGLGLFSSYGKKPSSSDVALEKKKAELGALYSSYRPDSQDGSSRDGEATPGASPKLGVPDDVLSSEHSEDPTTLAETNRLKALNFLLASEEDEGREE